MSAHRLMPFFFLIDLIFYISFRLRAILSRRYVVFSYTSWPHTYTASLITNTPVLTRMLPSLPLINLYWQYYHHPKSHSLNCVSLLVVLNSCLGNPMVRGAWQAIVHGVPQSWTWLSMHTLGVVHSLGLDKYIIACIHHQSIIQSSLTALKILCAPPSHSAPTQPLATADPFYCLHICLSRMADSQNHTLPYFYNWLLSLSMGIGGSSVSFHALIAYLFLVLNNILLSWM